MRRFNTGDIVTLLRDDKDYEVICADDKNAILAHTYLRLDESQITDMQDLRSYSNSIDIPMQEYEILFKV